MADFELRLHILPNEIGEFCSEIASKYGLYFLAMTGQIGEIIDSSDFQAFVKEMTSGRFIYIFTYDPHDEYIRNPPRIQSPRPDYFNGKLKIIMPIQRNNGTEVCISSARTFEGLEISTWKKVFTDLRKHAPVYNVDIVSANDGKTYPHGRHRISKGAIDLLNGGGKLFEYNTDSYYILNDSNDRS